MGVDLDLEPIKRNLEEYSRWGGETYEFVGKTRALVAEVEMLRTRLEKIRLKCARLMDEGDDIEENLEKIENWYIAPAFRPAIKDTKYLE